MIVHPVPTLSFYSVATPPTHFRALRFFLFRWVLYIYTFEIQSFFFSTSKRFNVLPKAPLPRLNCLQCLLKRNVFPLLFSVIYKSGKVTLGSSSQSFFYLCNNTCGNKTVDICYKDVSFLLTFFIMAEFKKMMYAIYLLFE